MEEFKLIPNHKEFEVSENGKVKEIATGKIKRAKIDKETGDRHIKLDNEDININKLVDELFKVEEVKEEVKEEVLVKEKPMENEVNKNMTIEVASAQFSPSVKLPLVLIACILLIPSVFIFVNVNLHFLSVAQVFITTITSLWFVESYEATALSSDIRIIVCPGRIYLVNWPNA